MCGKSNLPKGRRCLFLISSSLVDIVGELVASGSGLMRFDGHSSGLAIEMELDEVEDELMSLAHNGLQKHVPKFESPYIHCARKL